MAAELIVLLVVVARGASYRACLLLVLPAILTQSQLGLEGLEVQALAVSVDSLHSPATEFRASLLAEEVVVTATPLALLQAALVVATRTTQTLDIVVTTRMARVTTSGTAAASFNPLLSTLGL